LDVAAHASYEISRADDNGATNDPTHADRLFERTWRAAYPALRSRAQRLVGGRSDQADDLLGRAAIKALQFMRRSPQKLTDPQVFLFVVLRHVFLDTVRRHARDSLLFDDSVALDDDASAVNAGRDDVPEDWNAHREQLQRVAAALQTMPREQQHLFDLRFRDELPYSVIAERLGINEPLARKRVQLLRGRLMAALEPDTIHAPPLPAFKQERATSGFPCPYARPL